MASRAAMGPASSFAMTATSGTIRSPMSPTMLFASGSRLVWSARNGAGARGALLRSQLMSNQSRLAVLVDGAPLSEEEARALWTAFSQYMDEHEGDFAGFAKLRGYASVKPEARKGQAVLVVTTPEGASKPPPRPRAEGKPKPPRRRPR